MKQYYKVSEVATMLNLSRLTILRWIYSGKLQAVKPSDNGKWRVHRAEILRILNSQKDMVLVKLSKLKPNLVEKKIKKSGHAKA